MSLIGSIYSSYFFSGLVAGYVLLYTAQLIFLVVIFMQIKGWSVVFLVHQENLYLSGDCYLFVAVTLNLSVNAFIDWGC